jgi:hypothetical protein
MSHEEVLVANAVAVWKNTQERADKLFGSFDGEGLLQEVAPGRNRLIYLFGHLAAMHDRMLVLLGLGGRLEPAFDAIFLTSPDKASELAPVERVRELWKGVSERLNQGIAEFTPEQWLAPHSAVSAEDFARDPLRNRLSILVTRTNHLSYHLGQASLVRR